MRLASCALAGLLAAGVATTAGAATLSLQSDKATYLVGETITLTVTGDPHGLAGYTIYGRLVYDAALTETVTSSQTALPGWIPGALPIGDGFATVFSQITSFPQGVDTILLATAQLVVEGAGIIDVDWVTQLEDPGNALVFFGLTNAPGITIIIPEPTTATLLALGLAALAAAGGRAGAARGRR